MNTYTPGPYAVSKNNAGIKGRYLISVDINEGREIAVVKLQTSLPVTEATARLLAAAPELHKALHLIIANTKGQGGVMNEINTIDLERALKALALVVRD